MEFAICLPPPPPSSFSFYAPLIASVSEGLVAISLELFFEVHAIHRTSRGVKSKRMSNIR